MGAPGQAVNLISAISNLGHIDTIKQSFYTYVSLSHFS